MKKISISDLAYFLKEAKEDNQPQPIFFLGAGASKSGDIPLAGEIETHILEKYSRNPQIKKLGDDERSYAKLMECLPPHQRNSLLAGYINHAKINVTHIYLAQLLKEGYVDYVLTVNFDNLMLRALALYNIFPPTYDMAILKDLTTTTFNEKAIVYLHGQHHGLWLLNTESEMEKVKTTVPRIFDSIKNKRPWVFIGYSGSDPIFDHIKNLGRFDNGLYWVGYKKHSPAQGVEAFIKSSNTNASYIEGYDADAFMIQLNRELGLSQPEILDKPFTSLKGMLNNINDIDDREHFKGVKERLEMAKGNVDNAIRQFEKHEKLLSPDSKKLDADALLKEIIDIQVSGKYDKTHILDIEERVNGTEDEKVRNAFSWVFINWGNDLGRLAESKEEEEAESLYKQAFEKYTEAIALGGGRYNFACLHALRNNKSEALKQLEISLTNHEISTQFVLEDKDWAGLLDDPDFQALITRVNRGEESAA